MPAAAGRHSTASRRDRGRRVRWGRALIGEWEVRVPRRGGLTSSVLLDDDEAAALGGWEHRDREQPPRRRCCYGPEKRGFGPLPYMAQYSLSFLSQNNGLARFIAQCAPFFFLRISPIRTLVSRIGGFYF